MPCFILCVIYSTEKCHKNVTVHSTANTILLSYVLCFYALMLRFILCEFGIPELSNPTGLSTSALYTYQLSDSKALYLFVLNLKFEIDQNLTYEYETIAGNLTSIVSNVKTLYNSVQIRNPAQNSALLKRGYVLVRKDDFGNPLFAS
jgi:hypothetical protein